MNAIQKKAHAEGFLLVANAFKAGQQFDIAQATAWINLCINRDSTLESLAVVDRDSNSDIAQVRKFEATSTEMSGYRLAGICSAIEEIRANLERSGVRIAFTSTKPSISAGED